MNRAQLLTGFISAVALSALSLVARILAGLPSPLEALYKQLTHFLGVPAVFQIVHRWLGIGEAAKVLALVGSAALWIGGLSIAGWLAPLPAAGLVALASIWLNGPLWGLLWAAAYLGLRLMLEPIRTDPNRRTALRSLGYGAAGVFGIGTLGALQPLFVANGAPALKSTAGGSKLPSGITSQADLYYVSINNEVLDPRIDATKWHLELGGLVQNPSNFSLSELTNNFPAQTLEFAMSCISNPVGGPLIGNCLWTGLRVKDLLQKVGVQPGAKWILWESADGFYESLPLGMALEEDVLLAYAINHEPLNAKHGFPLRVILPGHYGMKQPRWLTKITLTAEEKPGYWADRGWSRTALVQPMSRIDTPQNPDTIKAGTPLTLSGIAYAGQNPVTKVEVSTDNAQTWLEAKLTAPRSPYAWTLWSLEWTPSAGAHDLVVRCEAGTTRQSSENRDSLPEAASGYHHIRINVG